MSLPLPWEATDREAAAYRHLLYKAGVQRLAGLCVGPHCTYGPLHGSLTCGALDCIDFEATAPEKLIHHWRHLETPEERAGQPVAPDWRGYFLAALLGGTAAGGLVVAAFVVGVYARWLHITA